VTFRTDKVFMDQLCEPQEEAQYSIMSLKDRSILLSNDTNATFEFEFPYPKICDFEVPPKDANIEIALFYHVGMLNNWKRVVTDQLHTLEFCGLGHMSSSLTISYSKPKETTEGGDATTELTEILNRFRFTAAINISFIESTSSPWEKAIVESVSRTCHSKSEQQDENVPKLNVNRRNKKGREKKVFVYYFHNKGVSHYFRGDDWVNDCVPNVTIWDYCNAIHWRKYMERFLLERPTLCLRAMLFHDALTCGVNLHLDSNWHYSGNFWAASCDYIKTVPPTVQDDNNYITAELWIGRNISGPVNYTKHVEFFDSMDIFSGIGLYRNVILPEQYSDVSQHRMGMYSGIWSDYTDSITARREVLSSQINTCW
jgi:hypothetical protein